MTENEYKHLRYLVFSQEPYDHKEEQAIIKIFEEIQRYRAIGTIEEFKTLKEKSVARHEPINVNDGCIYNNSERDWDFAK